jgi:dTDP-4-amino-4,6-dideoxygalactose transaminase
MKVPFVDLKLQYLNLKTDIDKAISDVIAETAFVGGSNNKFVNKFENEFAAYLGLDHVVSCANGTDSLEILLEAYGITAGDEVIVPALTWISTSEAVGRIGAKPIFIDVCDDTLLIDLKLLESKITKATKAIIPVHLYGNAVNMEELMRIANKYQLIVIEDCAQSHGAKYNEKLTGTFGHAASFSFYPGKNLGAYGDAGAIATSDADIAATCRMIANHGQKKKHDHQIEGRNSRMDGIHAAILSVKLKHLDDWNSLRNKAANTYQDMINTKKYQLPVINPKAYHAFHLFVIRSNNRDAMKDHLDQNGIDVAIHYPTALPFLKAYSNFGYTESDFPVSFRNSKKILSIPMFPELTKEQIKYISDSLNAFN